MSQVLQDPLEAGREAASRGAWPEAYEHLLAADDGKLTGHDLELLSHAALWTGHLSASIEYAERAYAYVQKPFDHEELLAEIERALGS